MKNKKTKLNKFKTTTSFFFMCRETALIQSEIISAKNKEKAEEIIKLKTEKLLKKKWVESRNGRLLSKNVEGFYTTATQLLPDIIIKIDTPSNKSPWWKFWR